MNEKGPTGNSGSLRERIGNRIISWGKRIGNAPESFPANEIGPELPIDEMFYNAADAVQNYFHISQALCVPENMDKMFRNRLAIAIAD